MSKEIRLNVFHMNSVGHSWAGLWRHPRDRSSDYKTLSYWTDLAQTAERGKFDAIFLADVFGIYDVYGGSRDATLIAAAQSPNADPVVLVSAMAYVTRNVGFGITASTTYEHPYQFARRFTTLDHLTQGRIGWNVVTGYLESGARGMGVKEVRPHDTRYDVGDDFLAAAYKLWEGSWESNAVIRDRRPGGPYTQPDKVHRILHDGPYYQVDGVHLGEPSPQRTPVLFQAGASARGKQFAGRHAECIFLSGQTKKIVSDAVTSIRLAAVDAGRQPNDIKLFLGANVIVAPTRTEAQELHLEYKRFVDVQGQLALISGWTGIDFSAFDLDDAVKYLKSNAIQSMVENITVRSKTPLKIRDLAAFDGIGGRGPFLVGSPQDVADGLIQWVDETGVDGFNLTRLVVPETLNAFVDLVIPELQARGRYKTEYSPGTLREKLFPDGNALLPSRHPGALGRIRTIRA
jgi:long-chain alkane monooxygenase